MQNYPVAKELIITLEVFCHLAEIYRGLYINKKKLCKKKNTFFIKNFQKVWHKWSLIIVTYHLNDSWSLMSTKWMLSSTPIEVEVDEELMIDSYITYSFLCQDDTAQQLVLETFHGHSKINDGCSCEDLGSVRWIRQFCCYVQYKSFHHITFLVSDLDLKCWADLDKVSFKDIV